MITRNNYEEYFLLYVDNELSGSDRLAVENFVDANPDLREEWELLLQCRIAPDARTVFGEKDSLRLPTTAASLVHPGNHEEYFISYIDGELDEATRAQVEEYLRLHPALLPEFGLLQQATFTPDTTIAYPDKESLYRSEKDRKIIFLPWGRIAAAAVTVGAIVLLIFKTGQGPRRTGVTEPGVALRSEQASDKKEKAAVTPRTPDTLYYTRTAPAAGRSSDTGTVSLNKGLAAGKTPSGRRDQQPLRATGRAPGNDPSLSQNSALPDNKAVAQADIATGQDLTVKKYSDPSAGRLAALDPGTTQRPGKILLPADRIVTAEPQTTLDKNSTFATQALLAVNEEETEDGLMDGSPPSRKKNKFRGFFRKVSRVLEKTTSRDEDDKHNVLIGGFQFALK